MKGKCPFNIRFEDRCGSEQTSTDTLYIPVREQQVSQEFESLVGVVVSVGWDAGTRINVKTTDIMSSCTGQHDNAPPWQK
jgi:hypothetical protein